MLEIIGEGVELDPLKIYEIPQFPQEIDQAISVNQHHQNWIDRKPADQQFRLFRMRPSARFGMIRQIAKLNLELRPDTITMLGIHYPELYFAALHFGLIK
jgi:hypothetical protein